MREEESEKRSRESGLFIPWKNRFVLTLLCEPVGLVGGQEKKEGGRNHEKE